MNRRHNRRQFQETAKQIPLGKAHLLGEQPTKEQVRHYVFEKRLQAAGQIYGSAVGIALTSEQFGQADQETKDQVLAGLAASAWQAAPFLLQEADLVDMVKADEPPPGANGGQDDDPKDQAQPRPSDQSND